MSSLPEIPSHEDATGILAEKVEKAVGRMQYECGTTEGLLQVIARAYNLGRDSVHLREGWTPPPADAIGNILFWVFPEPGEGDKCGGG